MVSQPILIPSAVRQNPCFPLCRNLAALSHDSIPIPTPPEVLVDLDELLAHSQILRLDADVIAAVISLRNAVSWRNGETISLLLQSGIVAEPPGALNANQNIPDEAPPWVRVLLQPMLDHMDRMDQNVQAMRTEIRGHGRRMRAVENQLAGVRRDTTSLRRDVRMLKRDVGTLKRDVGTLKTDVGTLKTDVGTLKTDVGTLKTDVGTLKTDVGTLKRDVGALRQKQAENEERVSQICVSRYSRP
jgi:outer membrane murein-binding lipoprotein Lpp